MPKIRRFARNIAQERFLEYLKKRKVNAEPIRIKAALDRATSLRKEFHPTGELFENMEKSRVPLKIISKKIPLSNPSKLASKVEALLALALSIRERAFKKLTEKYGVKISKIRGKGKITYELKLPKGTDIFTIATAASDIGLMLRQYRTVLMDARDRLVALEITYQLLDAPEDVKQRLASELGPNFLRKLERYAKDPNYRNELKALLKNVRHYWYLIKTDPEHYILTTAVIGLTRAAEEWTEGNNMSLH